MADMMQKQRKNTALGERCGNAILTSELVVKLRELAGSGLYFDRQLAEMFGIARSVVNKIRNRKLWAWLK